MMIKDIRDSRRAARNRAARTIEGYFKEHGAFLERVPLDQCERKRIYITVFKHDDWCGYFQGGECNCGPTIERFVEPRIS